MAILTAFSLAVPLAHVQAQLAITEVMSSAANTKAGVSVPQNSDFWELTNFGTNTLDLTGYKFNDDGGFLTARPEPFEGLSIGPGESVLFVRNDVNATEAAVREWWGSGLPAATQIRFYAAPGFSSGGDAVSVWDAAGALVDSVQYGAATRGRSFTYDAVTGLFGTLSANGIRGAWKAETADDEGSPGVNAGPVPLVITVQPTNTAAPAGNSVSLHVAAQGLPRPKFQWRRAGQDLPGATRATLTFTNGQPEDSGYYAVTVSNGLTNVLSNEALLTVNPTATPPTLTQLPADLIAYESQILTFRAAALGNPPPAYQWRRDNADLAEEYPFSGTQTPVLTIAAAQITESGNYSVVVSNAAGFTNAAFSVLVTRKPKLVITEVMANQATNAAGATLGHADWWELTNLDDFSVNLRGYRFDDSSDTRAAAFTLPTDLVIEPGESVVFVEGMTPAAFRRWWGESQLPPGLKIVSYSGSGLGLSSLGDAVNLWNAAAEEDTDKVASAVFSTAPAGVSFGYDPATRWFGDLSVPGVNGGIVAAELGDIGSPGMIVNLLRILSVERTPQGCELTWLATAARNYTVLYKTALDASPWMELTNVTAMGSTAAILDAAPADSRFYRVRLEP